MNLILTLITAIAGSMTGLLSTEGVISPNLTSLIDASVAAGLALFNAFKSGGTIAGEAQQALIALQAEYTAIQKDTSADPNVVGCIAEASNLVSYAIDGFVKAEAGADPADLPVPPPVV